MVELHWMSLIPWAVVIAFFAAAAGWNYGYRAAMKDHALAEKERKQC